MGKSILTCLKSAKNGIKKYDTEILTGMGIIGMAATVVMAVRATPKAIILIDNKKEELDTDKLEPKDVIKITWTCYIPAAITGVASLGCIISASSVSAHKNAVLAAAYTLSESTFKEYQDKVVETIGDKKEESIRDSIAKDKIEKNPVKNNEVLITGKGKTLCYDTISGRYFECDIDLIHKAEAKLNLRLRNEMYVPLNDFYYEIGLNGTKLGNDLGWNIDDGYISLNFSSQLAEDERPCLVVDYDIVPRYDYFK